MAADVTSASAADGVTTFAAPAKVNLFLHVVGRRTDGYHLIQSAMQLIDLADTLTIEPRADGRIVRESINVDIADENDLTMRAARMLQHAADVAAGATIAIDKHIPMGGGLGGGSSDAATVLLALNRIWKLDWPRSQLADIGLTLGADVPFFIEGRGSLVEGIGERITPIALPPTWFVVIHPGIAVATAPIFADAELTRDTAPIKISGFSAVGAGSSGQAPDFIRDPSFRNDLEAVAAARFSEVREALDWLSAWSPEGSSEHRAPARMSGSGACVIRAFADEDDATRCANAVPAPWSAWSVHSLATHPLRGFAPD